MDESDINDTLYIMNNTSFYDFDFLDKWMKAFATIGFIDVVLGTILNMWLLIAILTCATLRQSMRNKLICNLSVALALESMIISPVDLASELIIASAGSYFCQIASLITNVQLINDFTCSWIVVIILVFYLADNLDYDPSKKLTALSVRLATAGVLVIPWVGSLIIVPSVMAGYYHYVSDHEKLNCLHHTLSSGIFLKVIDTIFPVLISILLIIRTIIYRRRRFALGREINTELIGPGREIDSPRAYIAMVATVITCHFLLIWNIFNQLTSNFAASNWEVDFVIDLLSLNLAKTRVILLPLSCFLLPDLRRRLLTWRPWKRPTPGIDLTVVYEKDAS